MSEFSATPFPFVYASYRLTLIRSPQKSNKKNRNFGPQPRNPCINRWMAEKHSRKRLCNEQECLVDALLTNSKTVLRFNVRHLFKFLRIRYVLLEHSSITTYWEATNIRNKLFFYGLANGLYFRCDNQSIEEF